MTKSEEIELLKLTGREMEDTAAKFERGSIPDDIIRRAASQLFVRAQHLADHQ